MALTKVRRSKREVYDKIVFFESKISALRVQLCDLSITSSPSYATENEIRYYLLRGIDSEGYRNFISEMTGVPFIMHIGYLKYILNVLPPSDFKEKLPIIIDYLETEEHLKNLYDFLPSALAFERPKTGTSQLNVKFLKTLDEVGVPKFSVHGIESPYNSLDGLSDEVLRITDLYYYYFETRFGLKLPKGWTFLQGIDRDTEFLVIDLILEGHLKADNPLIYESYDTYSLDLEFSDYNIYKETFHLLGGYLESAIRLFNNKGFQVKSISKFAIYGHKKDVEYDFRPYLTHFAFNSDTGKRMDVDNQLFGLGGEFTSDVSLAEEGANMYLLVLNKQLVRMYRNTKKLKLLYSDMNFISNDALLKWETTIMRYTDYNYLPRITDSNINQLNSGLRNLKGGFINDKD